jgi:superfamily II DNA/RNA helicase
MTKPSTGVVDATSFTDLGVADDLAEALERLGITEPFPIQTLTIPDGLQGRDVCGKAQTGSGKTIAFGLPLVERTRPAEAKRPRALILVPTRELCTQVGEEVGILARARGLRLLAVYGGSPMGRSIDRLKHGVDIVVATPGRLIDHMDRKQVFLDDVDTVVIDEADQMADMGFLPQVHRIMERIDPSAQTMLFSATLDGQVRSLITRYLQDPVRHEAESKTQVVDTQEHRFLAVHHMDKAKVAAAITRNFDRSLVFVATKRAADRVAERLEKEGISAGAIHGDRRQRDREKALGRFRSGELPVLVATNVAARGLHIDDVDVVIHYDPPADYKSFIHRSGRTARAGESGLVVTLVEWDQVVEVQRIQRASGLHTEITKMYSNDPRLTDLTAFEPEKVEFKRVSNVELSRRAGRRRRR